MPIGKEDVARVAEDIIRTYLNEAEANRRLTAELDYLKRRIAEEDERLANA